MGAGGEQQPPFPLIIRPQDENPYTFWNAYLQKNPITAAQLLPNLDAYRRAKRFVDVEAALRAFLRFRVRDPEPWLYEMLAVAIEMNKGKPEDIRAALGYAADQAMKTNRANDLTRVADLLFIHGLPKRVGPLLDRAAELDPGDARPLWMSIRLAGRLKDPNRMGSAVERILALGWPGMDEAWRAEARREVEMLAKVLREAGRDADAATLLSRLDAAEPRDLVLTLSWTGDADLDLVVTEPLGATAKVATPRTVFGGAIVKNGYGKHPEEIYVCPRAFDGVYTIQVETIYNDEKSPAREAQLTILAHEGTDQEQRETRTLSLSKPEAVTFSLTNGRRRTVLPFQAPPPGDAVVESTGSPARRAPSVTPSRAADALRVPTAPPSSGASSTPRP